MRHPGTGLSQQLRLARINMDGVRNNRTRPENAELVQAINDSHAALFQAVVLVGLALGRVDVKAPVVGAAARFEPRIRERERGVQAERGRDCGLRIADCGLNETKVFSDSSI